jgi:hypothetical protein
LHWCKCWPRCLREMPGFWGVFEQFGVGLVFADEPNLAYREYLTSCHAGYFLAPLAASAAAALRCRQPRAFV